MQDTVTSLNQLVPAFWLWSLSSLLVLVFLLMIAVLCLTVNLWMKFKQQEKNVSSFSTLSESQQQTFSEVAASQQRLIDKMIAILGTKDPMAFQAVQAMNVTALQTDPVQEDYERSYDDVTGARYGNLDDPAIAAELTGLL